MQLLLVHGLGRTPLSLFGLAAALRSDGHRTRLFGYLPLLESVPRIVGRLTAALRDLARRREPVGLVGHSLGGLLLRMALTEVPTLRVHHLVTLGTPASPPRAARLAWKWLPPFRLFTRGCGRFLTSPGAFAALPPLTIPFTAIAGTAGPRGRCSPFGNDPNDGLVAVSEARVGTAEPELFPVLHTVMMDAVAVRARISAIMSGGRVGSPSLSDR
jgi:pimeloyl-ACP methyl ester carboxylesterase